MLKNNRELSFCCLWVMVLLYMIEVPLVGNPSITQLIWIPSILLLAAVSFAYIRVWYANETIALLFIIFAIMMGIVGSGELFSKQYWVAAICFLTQIIATLVCSEGTISKRTFDFIFWIDVILALLFFAYSFTPIAYKVTTKGSLWYTIYFVFNLDYSNLAGIYLYCIFCILLVNLGYRKWKLPIYLLMAIVIWMIYKTNARSCILSAFAVLVIYLFFSRRRLPQISIWVCMLFPVIFAVVYSYLYLNGYSNFEFIGKNFFTGREEIYAEYLSHLEGTFGVLFGNYGVNALQNAHNGPIAVFSSLGLVGFLPTYYLYYSAINRINCRNRTAISTACVACILGVFVQTSAEATMLLGGFPGIIFITTFFMLANYNEASEELEYY